MTVTLSPETEAFVRRNLEQGMYSDPDELVREALLLLEQRDRRRKLDAALAIGYEQYQRGEVVPWTDDSMDELDREVDERLRRGDQPHPDVSP